MYNIGGAMIPERDYNLISDKKLKQKQNKQHNNIRKIMQDKLSSSTNYQNEYRKIENEVGRKDAMECYLDYFSLSYESFVRKWRIGSDWNFYKLTNYYE